MPATFTTASSPPRSSAISRNRPRTPSASVTETAEDRAEPPAATMRPAVVSLGSGSRSDPVEGHEGVESDDEPALTAEFLGDARSDPTPTAGHHGDTLSVAHGAVDRTLSSRPSRSPAASHCSSRSR